MDQGLVSNPKDLERMTHELESLERRITDLEDVELDVMERLEDAQRELAQVSDSLSATEQELASVAAARDEKSSAIHEELAKVAAERSAAVEGMPEDLMSLYERIRTQKGVGAAELRARQCGGCRLTLNAADLAVIAKAPSDEVARCEECSRILVRTAESGL
jgi:predicted  nucleic acid-binding Zn-ribbon protein